MYLRDDIERIRDVLGSRMARGWLGGDPGSIWVRPMMSRRRCYLVGFQDGSESRRWTVDAGEPGIVLRPVGEYRERQARADVLVAGVMRLLRQRTTPHVLRSELRRLQDGASREGFDFHTIYEIAATQTAGFQVGLETLLSEEPVEAAA